jgi:hypothetical protein
MRIAERIVGEDPRVVLEHDGGAGRVERSLAAHESVVIAFALPADTGIVAARRVEFARIVTASRACRNASG